jgi:acetyl-CoA acetyltransferase family protein
MAQPEPVIVGAVRTPHGRENGAFADIRSEDLSIPLINEILAQTGLTGDQVDDLMWGCAKQHGEQGNNIARIIALLSDLGESVPATTINRLDGSSAQSIISASDAIRAGQRTVIIASGVESMSNAGFGSEVEYTDDRINELYEPGLLRMGTAADRIAEEHEIDRKFQDEYAYQSSQRAIAATESGRFADELVPVQTEDEIVEEDEDVRHEWSVEELARLTPVLEGGATTANIAPVSDGAAATLVTSREFAEEHGLNILVELGDTTIAGVDPTTASEPISAVEKSLEKTGRTIGDYDLIELEEMTAGQTVYCQRELGIDDNVLNVNGGAIAIGHAPGASGARLVVTLAHEMQKRGVDRGLMMMPVTLGQGMSIELLR